MEAAVNFVIRPFNGGIDPRDLQGMQIYIHSAEDIEKEAKKLDISVSKAKYVV